MILDQNTIFSDKQAIVATANSTNSIDLQAPGVTYDGVQLRKNFGVGGKIPLLIMLTQAFNNLTSLDIVVQTATDAAFTSPVEHIRMKVLLADLKKGYKTPIEVVPQGVKNRYMRLRYEVTGTAPTTGAITAGIVAAVDDAYRGNNI